MFHVSTPNLLCQFRPGILGSYFVRKGEVTFSNVVLASVDVSIFLFTLPIYCLLLSLLTKLHNVLQYICNPLTWNTFSFFSSDYLHYLLTLLTTYSIFIANPIYSSVVIPFVILTLLTLEY